ncbi:MAG: L-proline 4-hydroxylase [Nitrobacter sp.]|uniref:phytanoyl-CoA dioxygenase family protein n=1 Tax=Nitrobacter sp. TaxID=29420 RepID=UPI00387DF666
MRLTDNCLKSFRQEGYALLPEVLSSQELAVIRSHIDELAKIESESRVLERDGRTVRALHGCHLHDALFDRLVRLPAFLEPARQILESEVYTYQFKVNTKAAFRGDVWPWHQDYIFWRNEDGMPAAHAVNAMVFLDDVTEFNGPLYFMPGSHREGCIASPKPPGPDAGWQNDVSADLKYQISEEQLASFGQRYGLVAPKGSAGAVVFFDCNIVHGSPSNISPSARRMLIITYNAVNNVPIPRPRPRPAFLVGQATAPLVPLTDALCTGI